MKFKLNIKLIKAVILVATILVMAAGAIILNKYSENLKIKTDSHLRDLTNQMQTAVNMYFLANNEYPWCDPGTPGHICTKFIDAETQVNTAMIIQLIEGGQLSADFNVSEADYLSKIYLYGVSAEGSATNYLIVCFQPSSVVFKADQNTNYLDKVGTKDTGLPKPDRCLASGGTKDDCYWCVD